MHPTRSDFIRHEIERQPQTSKKKPMKRNDGCDDLKKLFAEAVAKAIKIEKQECERDQ